MRTLLTAFIATVACVSVATAQYSEGRIFAGPMIGFTGYQTSLAFGAMGEYAINDNWGAGLSLGYSSFSVKAPGVPGFDPSEFPSYDYSLLAIYAFGSYHFMPFEKFDPFVSLGLGYFNWNVQAIQDGKEIELPQAFSAAYTSGVGIAASAGARYHFSDLISGRITIGYPIIAALGVDFAFGAPALRKDGADTAQPEPEVPDSLRKKYPLYVGAYVNGKVSIKTEVAEGWKTGVLLNLPPDFGISIMAPFGKETNIGFGLNLGSSSYGYIMKPGTNATDSTTVEERFQYFNVFPHLNISGFIIGVNWGFKTNYTTYTTRGDTASMVGTFTVIKTRNEPDTTIFTPDDVRKPNNASFVPEPSTYVADIIEIRIGGSIPIVESDFGRLAINVMAGYTLTGMFIDYRNYIGSYPLVQDPDDINRLRRDDPETSLNPVIPSLSIGLQWDFKIGL